jgi:hypothetical protein
VEVAGEVVVEDSGADLQQRVGAASMLWDQAVMNAPPRQREGKEARPVLPRCHDRSAGRDGTGDYAVVRGSLAAKMTYPAFTPLITGAVAT